LFRHGGTRQSCGDRYAKVQAFRVATVRRNAKHVSGVHRREPVHKPSDQSPLEGTKPKGAASGVAA